MSKLHEKAMLMEFHQGKWNAKKRDFDAENSIKEKYEAKGNVGTFYKRLMPDYVSKINNIFGEAYQYHREQTVPYDRKGRSILMNTNYFRYVGKMNEFQSKINATLADMLEHYDEELKLEEKRLNKGFKASDYPTADEIKKSYRMILNPEPIPSGTVYAEDIDEEETKRINKEIEDKVNDRVNGAMFDVWKRVVEVVYKMYETLNNPDTKFHDTLVTNIEDLCEVLPHINITNDPNLEEVRKEILKKLTSVRPDSLRENPYVRQSTAKDALEILSKMNGYI